MPQKTSKEVSMSSQGWVARDVEAEAALFLWKRKRETSTASA